MKQNSYSSGQMRVDKYMIWIMDLNYQQSFSVSMFLHLFQMTAFKFQFLRLLFLRFDMKASFWGSLLAIVWLFTRDATFVLLFQSQGHRYGGRGGVTPP